MKLFMGIFLIVITSNAFADMKETLMKAAQDKKNQEQAMELAKKGMAYVKGDKKEAPKAEASQTVAPVTPTPAPKHIKKSRKKKIT